MEIITKVVWDSSLNVIEREYVEYDGPWELCKGDNSKKEQAAADATREQQNQLMQQQLAMQQKQIDMVNPTIKSILDAGGMLPQQEAAMKSILMNTLPQQFSNLQGQINKNLVARGISGGTTGAGSGDIARNFGQLGAMEAALQQQGLSDIQLQKGQGLYNAMGTALGIGSMYGGNVGTFNSGTLGALNAGVTAANNADQAATSWMGPVFGALGSVGSAAITRGKKG